jgi:hypothetical protein
MKIEVSNGEIVDKITILMIKLEKINDPQKKRNIQKEYFYLIKKLDELGMEKDSVLLRELLEINKKLWDIEDKIRDKERNKIFDEEFITLARNVYLINDERSKVKRKINEITNSDIIEEKSYQKY